MRFWRCVPLAGGGGSTRRSLLPMQKAATRQQLHAETVSLSMTEWIALQLGFIQL